MKLGERVQQVRSTSPEFRHLVGRISVVVESFVDEKGAEHVCTADGYWCPAKLLELAPLCPVCGEETSGDNVCEEHREAIIDSGAAARSIALTDAEIARVNASDDVMSWARACETSESIERTTHVEFAPIGVESFVGPEMSPPVAWAVRVAGLLTNGELDKLAEVLDGDAGDDFYHKLNEINMGRNPSSYIGAPRIATVDDFENNAARAAWFESIECPHRAEEHMGGPCEPCVERELSKIHDSDSKPNRGKR